MKKILTLILTLMLLMTLTIPAAAAGAIPSCVKKQATACMNREQTNEVVVIKTTKKKDGSRVGTVYLIYRNSHKGCLKLDITGKVIIGKNEHVKSCYHYRFIRNRDAEQKVRTWAEGGTKCRVRYTSFIDCDEDADYAMMVHSFVEYKQGRDWVTCKGTSRNTDGIAVCKDVAHEFWSCCDDSCPVVFMNE